MSVFASSPAIEFTAPKGAFGLSVSDLCSGFELAMEAKGAGCRLYTLVPKVDTGAANACAASAISLADLAVIAANFKHIPATELTALTEDQLDLVSLKTFQVFARSILGAESLYSKKQRIWEKAQALTRGLGFLFHESIMIKEEYWQEALLEDHPYGPDIGDFLDSWSMSKKITFGFDSYMSTIPAQLRPKSQVIYLNEHDRKEFEVALVGGKVFSADAPLDTSLIPTDKEKGLAIYVIGCDFKMYIGPYKLGRFHHSSFLSGAPVLGAGEIRTDKEGTILEMTTRSGHYKPLPSQFFNTFDFLEAHGVDLAKVGLTEVGAGGSITKHPSISEFIRTSPSPTRSLRARLDSMSPVGFRLEGPSPVGEVHLSPPILRAPSPGFKPSSEAATGGGASAAASAGGPTGFHTTEFSMTPKVSGVLIKVVGKVPAPIGGSSEGMWL